MLSIDLRGKRALVAGVADDGGYGFAIAKALAEAGATVCTGTWPPALNIFLNLLERGKMDEARRMSDGSLLTFEKIYPLDAAYDTAADAPDDVRTNKRYPHTRLRGGPPVRRACEHHLGGPARLTRRERDRQDRADGPVLRGQRSPHRAPLRLGGRHDRRVPRQPARQRHHGGDGLRGQGLSLDGDGSGGRRGALASVTGRSRFPASSRTPRGSDTRTVKRSRPRSPWRARRSAGPRTCCDRGRRGRRASSPARRSPPRPVSRSQRRAAR